ncbi:MAG: hypothetical protein U0V02_14530 [Anaerolineales bacterium]
MKKLLSLIFTIGLTLSACGTAQTQIAPPAQTSTPTLAPTETQTPIPSTATITPLPTIPTFTPTFDVSTIVTVTPAEKTECKKAQIDEIIKSQLSSSLAPMKATVIDITNDRMVDIVIENQLNETVNGYWVGIASYVCVNGTYEKYGFASSDSPFHLPFLAGIKDLNDNGVPEVVVVQDNCWGMGRCQKPRIFEWNSKEFVDISYTYPYNASWGDLSLSFEDIDKNGTIEILYHEGPHQSGYTLSNGPFREFTEIYSWDGKEFAPVMKEMNPPLYRFQAIDDADQLALIGRYDKALIFYKEAINNKELLPYSFQLSFYYRESLGWGYNPEITVTPTPYPSDPAEYPSLAAYAYYRIMLLHLVQGQETEAASTYQTLQKNFGADPYAAPYIEMATAFWESYQPTQRMYDGCAAAIQYAVEHPEILIPLGSDYHGWQSHIYEPADVCPFR